MRGIFSGKSHEWLESVAVICFSCADRPEAVRNRVCRKPPHSALQCDGSSYGGIDPPAIAGRHSERSSLSVPHSRSRYDLFVGVEAEVKSTFGLRVLPTPVRAPQANAYCERLMGTVRREYLDFMIPLHERQLRGTLRSWVAHYNKGRPHSSLGPGAPEPTPTQHLSQLHPRHRLPRDCRITVEDILGGLHHESQLEKCVA